MTRPHFKTRGKWIKFQNWLGEIVIILCYYYDGIIMLLALKETYYNYISQAIFKQTVCRRVSEAVKY